MRRLLMVAVVMLTTSSTAFGQIATGTLTGTVQTPEGGTAGHHDHAGWHRSDQHGGH
jgi:hypothetical protein